MHKIRNKYGIQRLMAAFVIIAMLFQIYIAATISLNPGEVTQKNWSTGLQSEKILLCTPQGFIWVDVNDLITQNSDGSDSSEEERKSLKFSCPLLKAFKYSILFAAILICLLCVWLNRLTQTNPQYSFNVCQQKVYLSLAPKQSPPVIFYA